MVSSSQWNPSGPVSQFPVGPGNHTKFPVLTENTLTVSGDFIQGHVVFLRHVAQEGEDDEAGEEAGQGVDGAGDDGVSVNTQ